MSEHGFECWYCKEPVDPNAYGTFQRVAGWAERRSAGGANAIRPPKKTWDIFAHGRCLDMLKAGHRPGQQSLG